MIRVPLLRVPRPRACSVRRLGATLAGGALVLVVSVGDLDAQPAAPARATGDSAVAQLAAFLARHPASAARPIALLQLAELLVRQADARFIAGSRSGAAADRPDYAGAIERLEELLASHPAHPRADAARYTLGVLYASGQRYGAAVPLLERAAASGVQPYAPEARFRLGDARFEMATGAEGAERRALFTEAARAYALVTASPGEAGDGELGILAQYKLGWSLYSAADPANPASYEPALAAFGRLVQAFDALGAERQARVGLRGEALEYMAVAFARAGGAEAASRYFLRGGAGGDKLAVLRRVAASLQEQGDDAGAVRALRVLRSEAPTDSGALAAQVAIVAIEERRGAAGDSAQAARLALVNDFAPRTAWAAANPALAERAAALRLDALQRSARYALTRAQAGERAQYPRAAELFGRLAGEFFGSAAGREARLYYAEALLGQGAYAQAGAAYGWAASALLSETRAGDAAGRALAERAARNAVVAYDSALSREPSSRAGQDSLFAAADRLAAAFPQMESARAALVQKGRRAAESRRWEEMAAAFRAYATRYPADDFAPGAARLVGDALFRQGDYAAAQRQWREAQTAARRGGRAALADSIDGSRRAAATAFADSLIARGQHQRAAEEVYVALADEGPAAPAAADALRDAIETYRLAIDGGGGPRGGDAAAVARNRARAIELAARLARAHPAYRYRPQYQTLRARWLVESGRRDEAIALLRDQVRELDGSPAAAEPRLRLAVTLDSAGQRPRAAAAYEAFAAAHPADPRAADALHNAAVVYAEGGERAQAARAYALFAERYGSDQRAGPARLARLALLRAAGDSAGAAAEFAALCARTRDGVVRGECDDAAARRAFERGVALFREFQPLRLVIAARADLTAAGVQRASKRKQELLRAAVQQFEAAIRAGSAEYLAAGTYYIGLAQYEYGDFVRDAQLPATLNEGERAAAANGAAAQAAEYYRAAERSWRALNEKAGSEPALASSAAARPWLDRARATIAGTIDRLGGEGARAPTTPATTPGTTPGTTP